jgi:hypothetical protein
MVKIRLSLFSNLYNTIHPFHGQAIPSLKYKILTSKP